MKVFSRTCFYCAVFACVVQAVSENNLWANTVSGRFVYQDRRYDQDGFTNDIDERPIRFAGVQILDDDIPPNVLGSGVTDDDGDYSIAIPNSGIITFTLRVYAADATRVAVSRPDLTPYTASRTVTDNTSNPILLNPTAVSADFGGGAFNIYDVLLLCYEFVEAYDGDFPAPPQRVVAFWEADTELATDFTPPNGIRINGRSNPNEYDDDVIMHEMGHFIAENFSQDNSPGGAHDTVGRYDICLTWSEGWASFFGSAARRWVEQQRTGGRWPGSPVAYFTPEWYVDNPDQLIYEIETPSLACDGADMEISVSTVLWDILDSGIESFDTLTRDFGLIWDIVHNYLPGPRAPVSLEDFWDGWIATYPGDLAATRNIFYAQKIWYGANPPDDSELNETAGTAFDFDPFWSPGVLIERTFYPVGDNDWFSFTAFAGASYEFATSDLQNGCDTYLELYDTNGVTLLASNDDRASGDRSSRIAGTFSITGTYYLRCYAYNGADAIATYGSYNLYIWPTAWPAQSIGYAPDSFEISTVQGGGNPPDSYLFVTNFGAGTMPYTIADNALWLNCVPAGGTLTGEQIDTVVLSIDNTGLVAGIYNASVTITALGALNSPVQVPVTLTVYAPATVAIGRTPSSMSFSVSEGGAPANQTLQIWNVSAGALNWTVSDDAAWLSLAPANGVSTGPGDPSSVTISVNTSGLSVGAYAGTITITAPGAVNSPQSVTVVLNITEAPAAPPSAGGASGGGGCFVGDLPPCASAGILAVLAIALGLATALLSVQRKS
jgi:hypothetical protein